MWETPLQKSKSIYNTPKNDIQGTLNPYVTPAKRFTQPKKTITYNLYDFKEMTIGELMEKREVMIKTVKDGNIGCNIDNIDFEDECIYFNEGDVVYFNDIEGILVEEVK